MKKLMYSLLTLGLAMLLLTPSYAQDADVDPLKASDVNADGIVNILDLVFVATYLGETPTEEQHPNPDVNGDGTVNILDLVFVAQHLGESIDPEDEADVKSLYKELVGTYELFKSEVTYVDDQSELVLEPPKFAGTMTISSDQRITQKFGGEIGFGSRTGTFEILTDEGVLLIKDGDVTVRATYTWDGTVLTITITAPDHVEKIFWRKLNNSVIDLQSPEPEPTPSAGLVSADPPIGSMIAADDIITLTFSSDPGDVTVPGGFVAGSGKRRQVTGPFAAGALTLAVSWTNGDGSISLNYTVKAADNTPPEVTGATVSDGEENVDTDALLEDGIKITFSEEVTGNIALQTEDGDDVGWIGWVRGKQAALYPVAGKELSGNTTYVIKGKFADAVGNETEISITFTTLQRFTAEENFVGYWPFDEGKGPIVAEVIGSWYDGEFFGGQWVDGMFGKALEFDGVDGRVVVGNYPTFDIAENMTFMAWFYPTDTLTNGAFIVEHDSFYIGFGEQGQLKFVLQPHDISVESTDNSLSLREWYHLAVTFDGKTMRVYIDGELNSELPNGIPLTPSQADLVIGRGFSGIIDEIKVYNKALSQDEIKNISIEVF
ncbi:MAG: dockerin type I domain-containing protein [Candidatus Poribacteria bacterium]|nr:dockerin type I domain-containing protein [Candidatus Poribacteria bacterium]